MVARSLLAAAIGTVFRATVRRRFMAALPVAIRVQGVSHARGVHDLHTFHLHRPSTEYPGWGMVAPNGACAPDQGTLLSPAPACSVRLRAEIGAILFGGHGYAVALADISSTPLDFSRWRLARRDLTGATIALMARGFPV